MSEFFDLWEKKQVGENLPLNQFLDQLPFNSDGLLPAITQQYDSGEILMMAWVNRQALEITLSGGQAVYWSRSRQALWRKGESSGQSQTIKEVRFDCDGDTVLYRVDQQGPACHTGRRDCFYFKVTGDVVSIAHAPIIDPEQLYR